MWGKPLWNLPQRWAIFGGYRWWKNKFGITPDQPNGPFIATLESTWSVATGSLPAVDPRGALPYLQLQKAPAKTRSKWHSQNCPTLA
jgi:hypothetical protein